jgi:hypothetical protein
MLDNHPPIPCQTVGGDDYRELATKIREIAQHSPLPVARRELARLAAAYNERAEHLDRRTIYC